MKQIFVILMLSSSIFFAQSESKLVGQKENNYLVISDSTNEDDIQGEENKWAFSIKIGNTNLGDALELESQMRNAGLAEL